MPPPLPLGEDATFDGPASDVKAASPAVPASAPAWFRRRRRSPDRIDDPPSIVVPADGADDTSWLRCFARWLDRRAATGYVVSLATHALLLVGLALPIVRGMTGDDLFSTIVSDADEASGDFSVDPVADVSRDLAALEFEVFSMPDVPTSTLVPSQQAMPSPQLSVPSVAASSDGSRGGGFQFRMPQSGKAVVRGSFTAWTVPEDPKPDQAYLIVIQIRLPQQVRRYRVSDLSGVVIGTDKYVQKIPYDERERDAAKTDRDGRLVRVMPGDDLPIRDHQVQLLIRVPGAEKLVRDTIEIRSTLLKERQTLEIVF